MMRASTLGVLTAVALVTATAQAQHPQPAPAADSVTAVALREGSAAAETRSVGGYAVLGFTVGFLGGATAVPLLVESTYLGVVGFAPLLLTLHVAESNRAPLPPELADSIRHQLPAYQAAFRVAFAERLAQRRSRTASRAAIAGGVTGAVAMITLFARAHSNYED